VTTAAPRLFLGMDGGGTKTAFVVVDEHGEVVARDRQPGAYDMEHGAEHVSGIIAAGLAGLHASAGITPGDIAFAAFGIPGYGERSSEVPALDAAPAALLGHDRYVCVNDMVGGWAGAHGGADGINVVAGTGSIAYGERDGVGHRVGGWSELFGDEGSAYWIGAHGLQAFTRMADGRAERGPLYDRMRARLGVTVDLDVIGVVVGEWAGDRPRIADLSKTVVEAADAGDAAASRIVDRACDELTELAVTIRTALGWPDDEPVPVSWSGGVFRADRVRAGFLERLDRAAGAFRPTEPLHDADVGTALYALRRSGSRSPQVPPAAP
jgi:N-acetylglucosamine kinase-like BadF-type ATPase